jgi:hypothetical protein
MTKIRLAFQAGATAAALDLPLPVAEVALIFGIGSGGLTPFECRLSDRAENEAVAFAVAAADADFFFGHLAPTLGRLFEGRDEVHFNVRIVGIETPQPREVIRAMADRTVHAHGGGCDCGCGCG